MSIPLDRLYHYINDLAQKIHNDLAVVYFFYPHGSRDIANLVTVNDPLTEYELYLSPEVFCNDQEPLNYELYNNDEFINRPGQPSVKIQEIFKRKGITFPKFNFRGQIATIWDHALLLHSEKNSVEVERYQSSQFIPVYYWSHAIIALDWFRYAEYVKQEKKVNNTFLIYNRAWAGTREYRLKFLDLLVLLGLENHCQTSVRPVDPELNLHYSLHKFKNIAWRPSNILEDFFPINTAASHFSADFDIKDYESTDIEVVLETLFDDKRLHLTEKSLRPIACGQPFILAGTPGSLEYLHSYGFKTFGDIWNEEYDSIHDPEQRLNAITDLMLQISRWEPVVRKEKIAQARAIAEYNKKHFFSQEFFNQITGELKTNLTQAFNTLETTNASKYFSERRKIFSADPDLAPFGKKNKSDEIRALIEKRTQQYNMRSLNSINK